ncbi:PREDICTED: mitochondrial inner membrane protease ATP23-like [Tarenaya hassleriana]|uniref:mitochondrial inner membrane protease ATP23-like n=1 Tax=Tarenaya hassleriana TaxID=28532 RepID=UPI00053C7DE4|nr:PREDICTED: mitochondrial inner membrane protease ATP23-like [Tarenaya hassleriana]
MEDETSPTIGSDWAGSSKRGKSIEECEVMIRRSLRNPQVKVLIEQMEKSGCRVGDNFIRAVVCTTPHGGAFQKGRGITICSNHIAIQDEVNQVIKHELIHAYDECRAKNLEWLNCAHHACSEIRANHLSGDCHLKRELLRGFLRIKGHEQECIRRRVMKSMRANPECTEAASKDAMEAIWDICYNDTKPFDRAP